MNYRAMNRVWEAVLSFCLFFGIDRFSKIFILRSSGNINLTSFLGPISRFTPIATGLLGGFLINSDKNQFEVIF